MAIDFNGATDRLDWSNIFNPVGNNTSIAFWMWLDVTATDDYIFQFSSAGETLASAIYCTNNGHLAWYAAGSSHMQRANGAGTITGVWNHWVFTWNGGTAANGVHIYLNGVEDWNYSDDNGANLTAATGSWCIAGDIANDDFNFNGKLAHVGAWNRIIASGEITSLAAGFHPLFFLNGLAWAPRLNNYNDVGCPIAGAPSNIDLGGDESYPNPSVITPAPPFISFPSAVGDAIVTLTKVAITLTGKSLFANRVNPLVKVATTATGKDIYFAKTNILSNVSLTLTGKNMIINKVNSLTKVAMILTGKGLTIVTGAIITLIKVVMTITGKALAANKINALTKVAIVTTGKSLFANMIGVLTKVAMTLIGKNVALNKLNNLAKGTLTLTGKAVTVLGGAMGRAAHRFFDFF